LLGWQAHQYAWLIGWDRVWRMFLLAGPGTVILLISPLK
jgi:hypothetical protein